MFVAKAPGSPGITWQGAARARARAAEGRAIARTKHRWRFVPAGEPSRGGFPGRQTNAERWRWPKRGRARGRSGSREYGPPPRADWRPQRALSGPGRRPGQAFGETSRPAAVRGPRPGPGRRRGGTPGIPPAGPGTHRPRPPGASRRRKRNPPGAGPADCAGAGISPRQGSSASAPEAGPSRRRSTSGRPTPPRGSWQGSCRRSRW